MTHLVHPRLTKMTLSPANPLPLRKRLIEIDERKAIPDLILLDPLHRLFTPLLTDIDRLNHRLNTLLTRQLQHGQHLRPTADVAATDSGAVGRKVLRHHLRQGFVGEADVVEGAVDGEGAHVVGQVEFVRHVGGVEDEVEGEGPFFGPVLVGGADELFGAQFERVVFFAGRVRESVGFGAEGVGPEEAEVPEAAAGGGISKRPGEGSDSGWAYIPSMATFLPGPVCARTRGL